MYQIQEELNGRVIFDYYSIEPFSNVEIIKHIQKMGGRIIDDSSPGRLIKHIKLPVLFYRRMKKEKYGIIHIHSDTAWKLSMYAIPARLAGIKNIIIHSHSSGINGDHQKLKFICHVLMKQILPYFADEYLTCSQKAAEWMYPKRYIPHSRFIRNGVKADKFRFNEENRKLNRKKLNIKDDEILIGTTGDYSFPKNPYYLINVFLQLYKRNNKYKLIFIGDGKCRTSVEEWAKDKPGYENMIFYGKTSEVGGLLSALDIYIMPSRFEGFPVSAVEAQVNGIECILSDCITSETAVLESCVFWNIEDNPGDWAERLSNCNIGNYVKEKREQGYEIAVQRGYDISQTAETVFQLYSMMKSEMK